ncbi:hypothetical protein [Treponema brennaborense]|uniref:Uncharacterized protein n=1 Tax=Treponema brennaborense (strain DSM 12168 / CIP 105900 / DD5/3) TaxID=906968 RepID=F4LMS9_TREBD|nr:hypothetical protein [Treponema brennaborense]AEE17819.1 hypothetical protein Trebr_2412 [Treponema brennaborense DSM 12168]
MQDLLTVIGIAAAVVLFAAAYRLYIRWKKPVPHDYEAAAPRSASRRSDAASSPQESGSATCPLCGTRLARGENLVSRVFREIEKAGDGEQRCTVLGCPHCYPACEPDVRRTCPVCGKRVPPDGWLIAKLYSRTGGKHHVRITGCTECHKKP